MENRTLDKENPYVRIKSRFEEINEELKNKELPLEKCLDLYEEAIRLGNSCADLIDTAELSTEEEMALAEELEATNEPAGGVPEGEVAKIEEQVVPVGDLSETDIKPSGREGEDSSSEQNNGASTITEH